MCVKARTLAGISILLTVALLISCSASVSTGGGGVVVQFTIGGKTFTIAIFDNVGAFNVQAGAEPDRKAMAVRLFEGIPADSPTEIDLTLNQADVRVIPLDGATQKHSSVAAQDGAGTGSVLVNVYMAGGDATNPCTEGSQVAQLELRLVNGRTVIYRNGEAVDTEAAIRLLAPQAALIRLGLFSLCLEVSSDNVTAEVVINQFGVTVHPSQEQPPPANDNADNANTGGIDSGRVVVFPDVCLENAVRNTINKDTGAITVGDLPDLTSLSANRVGISNLSGLEYCTSLEYLDLIDNGIADLDPLAGLPNLRQLHLGNNLIVDISPLADLPALEVLILTANQVSNLGALQGLTTLLSLNVSYQLDMRIPEGVEAQQPPGFVYADHTILSDISPLDSLTGLTELRLSGNKISDMRPLDSLAELRTLAITNNQITDLTPLRELPDLRTVFLNQNPLTDLRPLADNLSLGEGTTLYLNCCSPGFDCDSLSADPIQCGYVADLEARGVTVNAGYSDAETCAQMPPILGLGSGTCDLQ